MGCFGDVVEVVAGSFMAWLERHRTKKPDGAANQSRRLKKNEKKMKKEAKKKVKKERKANEKENKVDNAAKVEDKATTSGRRHRSRPPTPTVRRKMRSPPPARCMTSREMAMDLEESTGLNARVSNSGIAYTVDFRPGTPTLKPHRLRPLVRRRCAFSFEENALMQDILRREQIVQKRGKAQHESVKSLEAERRRLEAQFQKTKKVKQGQTKFVRNIIKRKKNLRELAQRILNMRADLVLQTIRTKRAIKELARRDEKEAADGGGKVGGQGGLEMIKEEDEGEVGGLNDN